MTLLCVTRCDISLDISWTFLETWRSQIALKEVVVGGSKVGIGRREVKRSVGNVFSDKQGEMK